MKTTLNTTFTYEVIAVRPDTKCEIKTIDGSIEIPIKKIQFSCL